MAQRSAESIEGAQAERQQQLVQLAEALLAAGSVAALASVIAGVLAVPLAVATKVAEIAIVDIPEVTGVGFILRLQEDNLIYRAAYIRVAANRLHLAAEVDATSLHAALTLEAHYFALHRRAELRRTEGGQQVADAIERYGDVVGWYATIRPTNRPNHRAAHEHNFRPFLGVPLLTGALPGVLPHCLCEVGPPIEGAAEFR